MRKLTRSILATTAAVGLLAIPGMAMGEDNDTSFTIDADSTALSIGNGGGAATLDDGGNLTALNAGTVTGSLPNTTVTDQRGTIGATWVVSVVATGDWLNQTDNTQTVLASQGRAYLDALSIEDLEANLTTFDGMDITGAELVGDVSDNNLGSAYTLVEGTTLLGDGQVVYTPIVEVEVPADTPAGTYVATVRQTVS